MFRVVSTSNPGDLLPQLPVTRPIWHTSTIVGLRRHICAYIPLPFSLLSQEIVLTNLVTDR